MARNPRSPSFSSLESKAVDQYVSADELGGVIYEFNQALTFPPIGGISSEARLLAGIHNYSSFKAFEPVKRELERQKYSADEVLDRLCFIEFNALMAVSKSLELNFEEVHQFLMEIATSFAESTHKDWLSSEFNSVEEFAAKELEEEFLSKSFLWRKYVLDSWNKKPAKPRLTSSDSLLVEKVAPGATAWISQAGAAEKQKKIGKPKKGKSEKRKSKSTQVNDNILDFEELKKKVSLRRNSIKRMGALQDEPAYLLSIPKAGWSWMCDYHHVYGLTDDEDEALFMAGAHMHYTEVDGDVCELFIRDWGNSP
jgi:hypothetical protein